MRKLNTKDLSGLPHQDLLIPRCGNAYGALMLLRNLGIFSWRRLRGALATQLNLFKRRCSPSPIFLLCNEHEESVEHVLLLCPWTHRVWFGGLLNYRVDPMAVTSLDAWILMVSRECSRNSVDKQFLLTVMAFTCWHIWKDRCKTIFN